MKILVLFGSSTGNTEELANTVHNTLDEAGYQSDLINVAENSSINYADYSVLFLGVSTWDGGQPQLDFRFHLEDLQANRPDLTGKKIAVFGTGESCYEFFCGGIDKLEEIFTNFGAEKMADSLKVDTLEEDPVNNERIIQWTKGILESLN